MRSWQGSKEAFTPSRHVQKGPWWDWGAEISVPELGLDLANLNQADFITTLQPQSFLIVF